MDDIVTGIFPEEGRLPSVREYAGEAEVNPNTVMRSFDWLQQQQIIYNKRGIGFFVLPGAFNRILEMRKDIFFNKEADLFFLRLKTLGISPQHLAELYTDFLNRKK